MRDSSTISCGCRIIGLRRHAAGQGAPEIIFCKIHHAAPLLATAALAAFKEPELVPQVLAPSLETAGLIRRPRFDVNRLFRSNGAGSTPLPGQPGGPERSSS